MKTADRRSSSPRGWLILSCVLFAGCSSVGTNTMVSVRAQADPGYVNRRAEAPPNTPAMYVIAKGRRFPSMFDTQVDKLGFDRMSRIIAADLTPRFSLADDATHADVVIVVYWGAVARPESSLDSLLYDPDTLRQASEAVDNARTQAAADFKSGNYLSYGQVDAAVANLRGEMVRADAIFGGDARAAANTADILGLRGLYAPNDTSPEAETVRSLLEDDRYFVTLIAYDARGLRLKQKWIAWTVRMSIPVGGRDFESAVREMSGIAAPLYGTEQSQLVLRQPAAKADR
ncbi:MAG TPA: hypothetical protein VHE61_19225 [Opitutaceae bacterium]|nr:hypothetical protein [Opitutaceae bacterium]